MSEERRIEIPGPHQIPAAGPGKGRLAKLAAWLRYAPPNGQLGGAIVDVLAYKPDQSPGQVTRKRRRL